ncbi:MULTISPECIES: ABC transporter ATP-binding protein [unclassified Bradyrhizobium]|uniref:ABC transporter ATP-binding protein n=1 Tax=Bradyrhizobium sp. USDA 4541 TaxID=2817704 RepID=UPI0020A4FBBA|nr:dipeptide ABC transporter ATP-binding protein [Bradyrhizobium sp. USDA 4541]MCP1848130.1 oligopeptide transport system ATP-binding protein [Bradyrhizobium sp. USDA 4541]
MIAPLLKLENVEKHYPVRKGIIRQKQVGTVRAVDGVSLCIDPGETLAIVGESGCGKSTIARIAMRLIDATAGAVWFEGRNITALPPRELRGLRQDMQMVFQDPYSSLNPRMTVEELIAEPMLVHGKGTLASRRAHVMDLLRRVDLAPYHATRYPHEFSGGQRQRIGIARALALSPKLIVCDEPVSALDVSIQAQVINLLKHLQSEFNLSYMFISHGLAVVRHMADRVAVMYLGQVVEIASRHSLFANPRHPYTRALLASVPEPDPTSRGNWRVLAGDVPSPLALPSGCRFHTRCPFVQDRCRTEAPILNQLAPQHEVACHFAETIAPFNGPEERGVEEGGSRIKRLALYAERIRQCEAEQSMPASD